jgi:hypothetical protein
LQKKPIRRLTMDRTKVVVGSVAILVMDGLMVSVTILDTKSVYGRLDVLIAPVSGSGQKWVNSERLKEEER